MSNNLNAFSFPSQTSRQEERESLRKLIRQAPILEAPNREEKLEELGIWNLGNTCYLSSGFFYCSFSKQLWSTSFDQCYDVSCARPIFSSSPLKRVS